MAVIYAICIYFGYESYVAFTRKRRKSKMAVSRHFEKTIFLTNNPIIKHHCNEGQNLISYTGILKYSGPVVTCDMSLLANCVAHNLFLVSMMMSY